MNDICSVLAQVIADTRDNPAHMRQVIYECARLAAKRQALLESPSLTLLQVQERMLALEQAIARIEATALQEDAGKLLVDRSSPPNEPVPLVEGPDRFARHVDRAQSIDGYDEASSFLADNEAINGSLPLGAAGTATGYSDRHDAEAGRALTSRPRKAERGYPPRGAAIDLAPTPGGTEAARRDIRPTPRDLERSLGPRAARIAEYATGNGSHVAGAPTATRRMAFLSFGRILRFALVALVAIAIYAIVSPRHASSPTAVPTHSSEQAAAPSTGEGALVTGGSSQTAPAFPLPSVYGVYAISNGQIIELEQVQTAPVDPRTRTLLQITTPSRVVLPGSAPTFLVYRRDLLTSAPEKVGLRIAARIARMMTFDATGKAVTAPPTTDSWLIRDAGHELRVRPVRENQEMILIHSDDPTLKLPAGRYVLMFGGNPYDFTIEGPVTNPAHCVESVATTRGPTFYECRTN